MVTPASPTSEIIPHPVVVADRIVFLKQELAVARRLLRLSIDARGKGIPERVHPGGPLASRLEAATA